MSEFKIERNDGYTPTSREDLKSLIEDLDDRAIRMTVQAYVAMTMNLLARELDEFKASQTAV